MQQHLTTKLIPIAVLALLLLVPLVMISDKIDERAGYLSEAKQSVSASWTGKQVVLPAALILPFEVLSEISSLDSVSKKVKTKIKKSLHYEWILIDKLSVRGQVETSVRNKGIYNVPVYTSNINVSGSVDGAKLKAIKKHINQKFQQVVYKTPFLATTVSDPRGMNNTPKLKWQNKTLTVEPGSLLAHNGAGFHAIIPNFDLNNINEFSYSFELRGMEQLSFIPIALENQFEIRSAWPHPQFVGDFLPREREIGDSGYLAKWSVTSFANNVQDKIFNCVNNKCDALINGSLGVNHIEPIDVYRQSERSVKYGILFIGLSFISFFIFETLMKLPIHPVQYGLVGMANTIFYLLLISLSENTHFGIAYLIASLSCVGLLSVYLKPILRDRKYVYVFSSLMVLLYSALYVIINMEDLAMLTGTMLIFVVLAVIMITTRNIDWYLVGDDIAKSKKSGHEPEEN